MQISVLGPVEVSAGGRPVAIGAGKPRALLALLALHEGSTVTTDRLVEGLWGEEPPATAVKMVQVCVSKLRRALAAVGDGAEIVTRGHGYELRLGDGGLDARRFERLIADSKPREALALWRGAPLADVAHEPFAAAEIRRLENLRMTAIELAIDHDLAAGRHREVVGEIEALVAQEPLRERLHAQRMLALYRCGRQAEALDAYRQARRALVEQIGVEPGPELRRVHEAILRHDASLELRSTELPRELDVGGAPAIVGRDRELRWLLARWDAARTGAGELVAVVGPLGIGRTRLAAELATEVHRQGADIVYAAGWQRSEDVVAAIRRSAQAERPTLLVVDDADVNGDAIAALGAMELSGRATLVVATVRSAVDLGAGTRLVLEPLDAEAVCRIVLLYAPGRAAAEVPIEELVAASGGVPGRIHDVASEWARGEASRRVVAVAPRAAADRDQLRSTEAELVGGVVDLQAARERGDLLGAPEEAVCPFKGLASFDIADAKFFFGRERLIAELVARAVGAPLLGVVGPSGSGKSSVVRAGLLPALAAGVLPGSDEWRQVLIRPGEHPLVELRSATADVGADERIVLAVDQFEEVFTACRDERERTAFIDALVDVANRRRGGVIVLAVRADFYGRCATHRTLSGLLGAGHVLVGPMQSDELRRAIELPARRAGLHVEPELVDALLADVAEEPGALPLLSAALLELWQRRDGRRLRHATYERTGGVRGAVARLAEQAYGELEPAQQDIARSVLLRLAGEGPGGVVVRRRIPLSELEGHGDEDLARVLAVLTDRRLLTTSATTVEVAHEALLREWPRLRGWLEEDAQGRSIHRHLADAAREWNDRGRDPGDVYRGARLAAALEWRAGHERELNPSERAFLDAGRELAGRAQRRLRLVLAVVVALLIVAVLGGVVALHQRGTARAQAQSAQAQRLGIQALTEGDLDRSLLLARQGVELDDSPATRSNLLAALLRAPAAVGVMRGNGSALTAIDIAPHGRVVAVGDSGGAVLFFDAASRRRVNPPFKPGGFITAVAFSADGKRLAVAGQNDNGYPSLDLVDARTHRHLGQLFRDLSQTVTGVDAVAFSPNSRVLVASYTAPALREFPPEGRFIQHQRRFIRRWDVGTGRRLGHPRSISSTPVPIGSRAVLVEFVVGGRQIVTSGAGREGTVIRDAKTLRAVRRWHVGGAPAAVSPDKPLMAFGAPDGSVHLLDLQTGKLRVGAGRHDARVTAVRFAPGSRRFVTAAADGRVIVWDVDRVAPIETLERHSGGVSQLAIAPDGRTAYSAGQNASVVAWDLAGTRRLGRPFRASPIPNMALVPSAQSVAATPDGAGFAVPDNTGYVDLFDSRTLARTWRIRVGPGPVAAVAIAPHGRTLAAVTVDGHLIFADKRTGRLLGPPVRTYTFVGLATAVALSGDGRWLATSGETVELWNAQRRTFVKTLTVSGPATPDRGNAVDVSLSPDGQTLAATVQKPDGGGELDVAPVPGLAPVKHVTAPAGTWGRFSPDGRLLLYGDRAGRVWLFDKRTWKPIGPPLVGHTGPVLSVNLSPDGHTLASTSADGTARLWDLASGRPIGTPLPGIPDHRVTAAFVDGGRHLVTVYDNGRGYLWDVSPQSWARRACDIAGRTLTPAEWEAALPERSYAPACVHP
jgi:WD40 repeat protein/DNA-binding SARP family transcriptional activator